MAMYENRWPAKGRTRSYENRRIGRGRGNRGRRETDVGCGISTGFGMRDFDPMQGAEEECWWRGRAGRGENGRHIRTMAGNRGSRSVTSAAGLALRKHERDWARDPAGTPRNESDAWLTVPGRSQRAWYISPISRRGDDAQRCTSEGSEVLNTTFDAA